MGYHKRLAIVLRRRKRGRQYPKLDRDGKELKAADSLLHFLATRDTRKVDKGGLDNALLAADCVHIGQLVGMERGLSGGSILRIDSAILEIG